MGDRTDLSEHPKSKPQLKPEKGEAGGAIPWPVRKFFYSCYLSSSQDRKDPRISPLHANPALYPARTTIITCGRDSLCREAKKLADKLKDAGKDLQYFEAEGQGHEWDKELKSLDSKAGKLRTQAYDLAFDRLK